MMKAEINNENKAKFFAMYWGQRVFVNPILSEKPVANTWVFDDMNTEDLNDEYLELKPLSAITEEDAIQVSKIWGSKVGSKIIGRSIVSRLTGNHHQIEMEFRCVIPVVDFLRSKGYALPWMGLSVEELIEAGWVKLIGGNNA